MINKKEKIEKQEKEKLDVKTEKKQERQIKLAVAIFVVIIGVIAFGYYLGIRTEEFEYLGLKFEKAEYNNGDLIFYDTEFPLRNAITGQVISYFPYRFREDPRELEDIKIYGAIGLMKDVGIIADDPEILSCGDSVVASVSLMQVMNQVSNGVIKTVVATSNKTLAEENPDMFKYARCTNALNYSIIEFRAGNQTEIRQKGNCYVIDVADCEIMNATERFMVGMYAHSRHLKI